MKLPSLLGAVHLGLEVFCSALGVITLTGTPRYPEYGFRDVVVPGGGGGTKNERMTEGELTLVVQLAWVGERRKNSEKLSRSTRI